MGLKGLIKKFVSFFKKEKKELTFALKEDESKNENYYDDIVNRMFSNKKLEIRRIIESHIDYTKCQNVDELIAKSEKELNDLFNRESIFQWGNQLKTSFKKWLLTSDFFMQIHLDPKENYSYYYKNKILIDFTNLSPSKQINDVMMYAKNEHRVLTKEYVIRLVAIYFLQLYKNMASLDNIYSYLIALIPMEKYFEWYKIEDSVTVFFKRVNEQFKEFGLEEIDQKELLKIFEKSKQYEYLKKTFGEFEKSFDVYKRYEESRENVQISTSSLDKVQSNLSVKQNESLEEKIIRILNNNEDKIRKILLDTLTDSKYMYLDMPIFDKCKDKIKPFFARTEIEWTENNEKIIEEQFRKLSVFVQFHNEQKSNASALNVGKFPKKWGVTIKELVRNMIDFSISNNLPLNPSNARIKLGIMYFQEFKEEAIKTKEGERKLYKNLVLFISDEELKSWLVKVKYNLEDFFLKIKNRFKVFSVIVSDETTFKLGVMESKFFFAQREENLIFRKNYSAYIDSISKLNNQTPTKDTKWITEEITKIIEKESSIIETLLKESAVEDNIGTLIYRHENEFQKIFNDTILEWTWNIKYDFIRVLKDTAMYKNAFENFDDNLAYFLRKLKWINLDFSSDIEKNLQEVLKFASSNQRPLDKNHAYILIAQYYINQPKLVASTIEIYNYLLSLIPSSDYALWKKESNNNEEGFIGYIVERFHIFGVEIVDGTVLLEVLKKSEFCHFLQSTKLEENQLGIFLKEKETLKNKIAKIINENAKKIKAMLYESLDDESYLYSDISFFKWYEESIKKFFVGSNILWTTDNRRLIEEQLKRLEIYKQFCYYQYENIEKLDVNDVVIDWPVSIFIINQFIKYSIKKGYPLSAPYARIKLARMFFKEKSNDKGLQKILGEESIYCDLIAFIPKDELKTWLVDSNYDVINFFSKIKKRFRLFLVKVVDDELFEKGIMQSKYFLELIEEIPQFKNNFNNYYYHQKDEKITCDYIEVSTAPEIVTENIEPTTIQMDSQTQDEKDPLDCFMQVLEKKSFKSKKENEIIEALFDIEDELKNVEDCLSDYHSNEVGCAHVIKDDEINDLMY